MKILVTNDDGIYARGLWTLAAELQKIADVVIVAPDREQSATGTSVTLHRPLRFTEVKPLIPDIEAYSVEGTPSDSVILALGMLEGVRIVFSGINEGVNLGDDVLISGTVGAALQGYFHGLPSIALSVMVGEDVHFEVAAGLARSVAGRIINDSLSTGMLLNINLPNLPLDAIKGVEITRPAGRNYRDLIEEGHDGKRNYYWIVRGEPLWNKEEGTDIRAVEEGRISITPLRGEMSMDGASPFMEGLKPLLLRDLNLQ
ncbi:5'/3'-nucleotidase SurE [Chloroflexota bacterium]